MNKYVWIGCLAVLMLTGCSESKEEERERKFEEFMGHTYDNSSDHAKRKKLYHECFKRNVRDYPEMREEAIRISGNSNIGSAEFLEVFEPMDRERDAEVAKCKKIRDGN